MKILLRTLVEIILTACARVVLWRHNPQIIAVTGSAGKSTTKTIIGSAIEGAVGDGKVLTGFGNLGSVPGVPLALLSINVNLLDFPHNLGGIFLLLLVPIAVIRSLWLLVWPWYPEFVVLELTADRPGDFKRICEYLKPNVSVVLNIGPAHLLHFKTFEGIAKEKGTIVEYTRKDGLVILNKSDLLVTQMASRTKAEVINLDAKPQDFAKAAARLIGQKYSLSKTKLEQGLENVVLPKGRADVLAGINDSVIIDATYNANPISMEFELERLTQIAEGRKIAILGDMLELGEDAASFHIKVGRLARAAADYLIVVGPLSKVMPADIHCDSAGEATEHLLKLIRPGDTILVKASHGMHLEQIVKALKGQK